MQSFTLIQWRIYDMNNMLRIIEFLLFRDKCNKEMTSLLAFLPLMVLLIVVFGSAACYDRLTLSGTIQSISNPYSEILYYVYRILSILLSPLIISITALFYSVEIRLGETGVLTMLPTTRTKYLSLSFVVLLFEITLSFLALLFSSLLCLVLIDKNAPLFCFRAYNDTGRFCLFFFRLWISSILIIFAQLFMHRAFKSIYLPCIIGIMFWGLGLFFNLNTAYSYCSVSYILFEFSRQLGPQETQILLLPMIITVVSIIIYKWKR